MPDNVYTIVESTETTIRLQRAATSSGSSSTRTLEECMGKSIDEFCPNGYTSTEHSHCAHFVSHYKGYSFGHKCRGQTDRGPEPGATIRVNEIFEQCPEVGKWSDKRADLEACLAFVTHVSNVNIGRKYMSDHPRKHIGIFSSGMIYHYSNSKDEVVKQTPEEFKKHYPGDGIEVFYGTFPNQ